MVIRKITKSKRVARRVDSLFRKLYPDGLTNNADRMRYDIITSSLLNDRKRLRHFIKTYKNPFKKAGFGVLSKSIISSLLKGI